MKLLPFATLPALALVAALLSFPSLASADESTKSFSLHARYELSSQCQEGVRGVKLTEIAEARTIGSDNAIALITCEDAQALESCQTKYGAFTIKVSGGIYSLPVVAAFTCQAKP